MWIVLLVILTMVYDVTIYLMEILLLITLQMTRTLMGGFKEGIVVGEGTVLMV